MSADQQVIDVLLCNTSYPNNPHLQRVRTDAQSLRNIPEGLSPFGNQLDRINLKLIGRSCFVHTDLLAQFLEGKVSSFVGAFQRKLRVLTIIAGIPPSIRTYKILLWLNESDAGSCRGI